MIRILFYTVIVVLILSFFGVSLQSIIDSPTGQENIAYVAGLFVWLWHAVVNAAQEALAWLVGLFT